MHALFPIAALLAVLAGAGAQTPEPPTAKQGADLLRNGNPAEARQVFESILSRDPSDAAAQQGEAAAAEQLALGQRAAGNMTDALETLIQAERFAPQSSRLAYDAGILEDEMHLYPEALQSFAAAEQLHMDDPKLLYAEARVYLDEQQLAPAEEKMRAYLKLRPDDASAHYGLGRIYQIGLRFDEARTEFEDSLRLHPEQTEAWYELGDIALKQNQPDAALTDFGKVLTRNPQHGGALAGAGEACYQKKDYSQALDYLNRAVAAAPDYRLGHYYLGMTLARLGRKDESERELATAAKLADQDNRQSRTRYQLTPAPGSP